METLNETKIDLVDLKRKRDAMAEKNNLYSLAYIKCYNGTWDKEGEKFRIDLVIDAISKFESIDSYKTKAERPIVLFSVTDNHTNKEDVNVTKHSGLIVLDIDRKDNPDTDFEELRKRLCMQVYTHACFYSPSGGLKALVRTNICNINHHKAYFLKLCDYFEKQLRITIDRSGQNVARMCFMSYDKKAYLDRYSKIFCLDETQLNEGVNDIARVKRVAGQKFNKYSSLHDLNYYEVFRTILEKGTSMGLQRGSDSTDDKKGTQVGLGDNVEFNESQKGTSVDLQNNHSPSEKGTSVVQSNVIDVNNSNKGTSVGLYDNIYNKYRYNNIYIMCTDVPFFLGWTISQEQKKNKLNYETRIDERYFGDDKQQEYVVNEGIEYTKISFNENSIIKEGSRHLTLASVCMKLIFNNPFCTFERLLQEVTSIHLKYLDRDAKTPFNEDEIYQIVAYNYQRYINCELDFTCIIRKQDKNPNIKSLKKVFFSRDYEMVSPEHKQKVAIKAYNKAKLETRIMSLNITLKKLQNGSKITNKRIAEHMGVCKKTVDRYFRRNEPEFQVLRELKDDYNRSIRK